MTAPTRAGQRPPAPGACAAPALALLYLDVRAPRLHLLNEAARQLRAAGVPLLGDEEALARLRTLAGEGVSAGELPLRAAARGRAVEAGYVLSRPGQADWHLSWVAAPLGDAAGQVTAVLAAVCCSPPPPDWHALAGLAHDLRTPLQTLRLLSAALGQGGPVESQHGDDLGRVRSAAEWALEVGADVLAWCRAPASGGRQVESAWFPLAPFLASLAQEQYAFAELKGVRLRPDLSGAEGWEAHTDRVRLGRVLANLLGNAVRYTTDGGQVTLTAAWRGDPDEGALALEVADTGAGISPEEQESIFEPFQRGSAGRGDSSGGTGLGLSVVDRLVGELGLRHEFASESGRGSAFRVVLPRWLLRRSSGGPAGDSG